MISAVDTNVLLDVLRPNPVFVQSSSRLLNSSSEAGVMVICEIVYAELASQFHMRRDLDRFLEDCRIRVDSLGRREGWLAGRLWREYRRLGGKRDRIISDFLIGAHAQVQASRLLSRDRGFYKKYFADLSVVGE